MAIKLVPVEPVRSTRRLIRCSHCGNVRFINGRPQEFEIRTLEEWIEHVHNTHADNTQLVLHFVVVED